MDADVLPSRSGRSAQLVVADVCDVKVRGEKRKLVQVEDGTVYAAAGIAHYDGTHVVALNAKTGKPKWHNDASGTLNINDPIFNLIFQFLGGVIPVCKDALDTDDSGTITINDPIISLTFQFLGGVTIPLPGPDVCGPDPTNDNEDCEAYPQDKCQ